MNQNVATRLSLFLTYFVLAILLYRLSAEGAIYYTRIPMSLLLIALFFLRRLTSRPDSSYA